MNRISRRIMILAGLLCLLGGTGLWCLAPDLDRHLFDATKLEATNPALGAVHFLTAIGGFAVLGPLALAIVAWLSARRRTRDAIWLFATIAAGRLAVEALKELIARPRPPLGDRLTEVTSLSFPSSHSAGTLLTWLAIAQIFPRLTTPLTIFAAAMALTIGWSRLALGVHWPSDVLAGWGCAMLCVGIATHWRPAVSPADRTR